MPDTGAAYLVSARWAGVEHFAPPLGSGDDASIVLMVADTSTSAPVGIAARHVVVSGPASDGARTVVDLVIVSNTGTLARVRAGDEIPSWSMLLPTDVVNVRVADSDFSPTAFDQHGDTLMLFAPIPPGQREIFIDYQLAPGVRSLEIPVDPSTVAFTLMSEESLGVETMVQRGDTTVNGRDFHRWSASREVPPNVVVRFPLVWAPRWLVGALAAGLVVGLLLVSWRATRRRTPDRAPRHGVDELLERLARLDAAHAGDSAQAAGPAWESYLKERARLKAALHELLPR